jgi:FAD binding domain-containing protein/D-arabinono-1,4-lactone oxidase
MTEARTKPGLLDRRALLRMLTVGGAGALGLGCGGAPGPITKVPSWVALEHPETEEELVRLVQQARARGVQLRVRGSLHSVGKAIFTDEHDQNINVQLDRYNRILCWDEERRQVTVQAGIHLGLDPLNPASTWENSLNLQLQERGWALPDLGGITHQTVGGFLSTGSAGGSLKHDVGSAVVRLRIVAGDGRVYDLAPNPDDPRDEDTNAFFAAGVAMGLFGIISTVTFQCVPTYNVLGQAVTAGASDARAPALVYEDGPRGLRQWSLDQEYHRALIWPQRGIDRIEFWSARRSAPDPLFKPKPYVELAEALQHIASAIYKHVDQKAPPYDEHTDEAMRGAINLFISNGSSSFRDYWYRGLPTDNAISDVWMPTEFTELFIDLERTGEMMRLLREFWRGDTRMDRTGPSSTEVYASAASRFWLSPAFRRPSMRVDFLWFKSGKTRPEEIFYPQYWELLRSLEFRFHWGKHLSPPESSTGVAYRRARLGEQRWAAWLAFRERFDPDQIFVNDYWRKHLGIPERGS